MKKLLFAFMMLCCLPALGGESDKSKADSAVISASASVGLHALYSAMQDAEVSKAAVDAARQSAEATKRELASIDSSKQARFVQDSSADLSEFNNASALMRRTLDAKNKEIEQKEKSAVQDEEVIHMLYDNLHSAPILKHGHEAGLWMAGIISVLSLFLIIIILTGMRNGNFNLKDALSENQLEKKTIINPRYNELLDIIKARSVITVGSATAGVGNAVVNNPNAEASADANMGNASGDAGTVSADALANNEATSIFTPAMLANLSAMFPPTIDVHQEKDNAPVIYRASASRLIALLSALLLLIVGLACTCFFLYFYLATGTAPDLSRLSVILIALGIGMAPYAFNKVGQAASGGK